MSKLYEIKAGIPQGCVLGPILYTIFPADIPVSDNITIATYADDTAVLACSNCPTEASYHIQAYLYLLEKWLSRWNIEVNSDKSSHMTFAIRRGDCASVVIH